MRTKIRRQKPVIGGRRPLPSCVLKSIEEEVRKRAWRLRVSRSWYIAVVLADHLGIKDQELYDGE